MPLKAHLHMVFARIFQNVDVVCDNKCKNPTLHFYSNICRCNKNQSKTLKHFNRMKTLKSNYKKRLLTFTMITVRYFYFKLPNTLQQLHALTACGNRSFPVNVKVSKFQNKFNNRREIICSRKICKSSSRKQLINALDKF